MMTREEALESGIRTAWRFVGDDHGVECVSPEDAAYAAINSSFPGADMPDELEGFAVGLQLVAVEVAEIARERREAEAATPALTDECGGHGPRYICPGCDVGKLGALDAPEAT